MGSRQLRVRDARQTGLRGRVSGITSTGVAEAGITQTAAATPGRRRRIEATAVDCRRSGISPGALTAGTTDMVDAARAGGGVEPNENTASSSGGTNRSIQPDDRSACTDGRIPTSAGQHAARTDQGVGLSTRHTACPGSIPDAAATASSNSTVRRLPAAATSQATAAVATIAGSSARPGLAAAATSPGETCVGRVGTQSGVVHLACREQDRSQGQAQDRPDVG